MRRSSDVSIYMKIILVEECKRKRQAVYTLMLLLAMSSWAQAGMRSANKDCGSKYNGHESITIVCFVCFYFQKKDLISIMFWELILIFWNLILSYSLTHWLTHFCHCSALLVTCFSSPNLIERLNWWTRYLSLFLNKQMKLPTLSNDHVFCQTTLCFVIHFISLLLS